MSGLQELSKLENMNDISVTDLELASSLLQKNGLNKFAAVLDDIIAKKYLVDLESKPEQALSEKDVYSVFDQV